MASAERVLRKFVSDLNATQTDGTTYAIKNGKLVVSSSPATTDALPEGSTNLYFTVARVLATTLAGFASAVGAVTTADTILSALGKLQGTKVDKVDGKGLSTNDYTTAEQTKLSGIATGATANSTDAFLLSRANHTGTQAISTVTNLQSSLDAKAPLASPALTGTPTAPTAAAGTNTTQLATTAFVASAVTAAGATNLSATPAASTVTVNSSTGTAATLPAATASLAGVQTAADKTKLDGIAAGAQVNTVTSVAGRTGAVTLAKGDVGLGNVDNTADTAKPVSTAQQAALDSKAALTGASFTGKVSAPIVTAADYLDKIVTSTTAAGTVTIDLSVASVFDLTLTGNTTLAFGNAPALSGENYAFLVIVRQGATAYTLTLPSGVTPVTTGGAAVPTPGASKRADYIFSTTNGTAFDVRAGAST